MNETYKRQTLIRAISFSALFVAINVLCSFLAVAIPVVGFILIIFLPLTSALVEINIKDRWFPIYALATIGLSIVATLSSIDFTLFYVIPSIFTGYIFGLSLKRGIPNFLAIFAATLVQTILSFVFIKLLNLITSIDIVEIFAKILRISDVFLFNSFIFAFFFAVGLIQVILSFIVVENELQKFGVKQHVKAKEQLITSISLIASIIFSGVFALFYMPLSLLFIVFAFYFSAFTIFYEFKRRNKICLIIDGVGLFTQILLFALLNQSIEGLYVFLLLLVWPFIIFCVSIFHYFLKKSKQ
jgi:hypothetical protein